MSRADWDGLLRGVAAGASGQQIKDAPQNPPLVPQPIPPDAKETAPVVSAPTAEQANIALPQAPPPTGLGMLPPQQAAPQQDDASALAAFKTMYPGAAEGGVVDVQPQGLGALPANTTRTPSPEYVAPAAVAAAPAQAGPAPAQQAIPTEQAQTQEPQAAFGIPQSEKDAWDIYRADLGKWVFDSENKIRRTQGETGVDKFRQRFMEQQRRKSVGYATTGGQALNKGNNKVAAGLFNKMLVSLPIALDTWFEPNDSGGVTAVSPDGSVDYGPKEALKLMAVAMSTTDNYVQYLNSQQGYEVDKERLTFNRDQFKTDTAYKKAKLGLEYLGLKLQKEIAQAKIDGTNTDGNPALKTLSRDLVSFVEVAGDKFYDLMTTNDVWKQFIDASISLLQDYKTLTSVEAFNIVSDDYLTNGVPNSGNAQ